LFLGRDARIARAVDDADTITTGIWAHTSAQFAGRPVSILGVDRESEGRDARVER
jgi:hypothetical protein